MPPAQSKGPDSRHLHLQDPGLQNLWWLDPGLSHPGFQDLGWPDLGLQDLSPAGIPADLSAHLVM
jgi:hypothetical protein